MEPRRHIGRAGDYIAALLSVLVLALVLIPLRSMVPVAVVELLFVPVIVVLARTWGTRPSATAAAFTFVLIDLLYVTPYYTLTVASLSEWLGLMVFLIVALIAGQQTGRLREREQAALRRQKELELLNRLSFRIASESPIEATAAAITREVVGVANASRVALYRTVAADEMLLEGEAGAPASEQEHAFVEWVVAAVKAVGYPVHSADGESVVSVAADEALPGRVADAVYLPLQTMHGAVGVLVARSASPEGFGTDSTRLLVSVANLSAAAFEGERLAEEAARTRALRETDRMKSTFVSSVSHELKTPLAAATARITGLLEEGASCDEARVREELEVVAEDLDRLNGSIGDLLDLSRLESDAWRTTLGSEDIADILGTALSRIPRSLATRIRFDLDPDLPPVSADFAQLARAFVNLFENALAYSGPDSNVQVGARRETGVVRVWVEDRGPGILDAEKPLVFDKFYRGTSSASRPGGTGLGLALASEIVRAHGGTIDIEDARPHGSRFVMRLPIEESE